MTNQQGAPEALRPIQRYKIGYHSDEWGVRSSTPGGISDPSGQWVLYKDHIAALVEEQQPAPSAAAAVVAVKAMGYGGSTGINDYLMSDGTVQAMRPSEVKWAPQPSPTPQADSAPVAAPAAQQAGEVPLPLLVRDIASDLGTTPIQVCVALASLGFGGHSVNMAVTPQMARSLRAHFAPPTPQADPLQPVVSLQEQEGMYEDDFAPQADSQPAQVEVADAMADSQYLAGVSAGWNAANADDPNAALQKLHESRAGYLKPLRAARASADSQPAPVRGIEDCPELNMSNYGELEVGRLNDWAIRASAEIDRLSAARAPADSVTAPAAFQRALDIRTAQGWKLGGDKVPVLYTDTINGKQVCRDDIWLCTTAAFSTPPAQAADSVREDAARWREHVGKLDALVAYCPTCCQGFVAKQDMTRDEVLFACGKAVGQSGAKRLREALDLAVGHIDMDALRISHCKDAAAIDAARKQGGTA